MSRRTIQSPGVEIREIDLSQRPAAALGTSVFIAGFSNQGPTDEIFNVGTFAEFEEIYGSPTTAAERYFYHSAKQVFESDANVYASRLPYGSTAGDYTYSALTYPVVGAKTSTVSALSTNVDAGGLVLKTNRTETAVVTSTNVGIEIILKDSNDEFIYINYSGGSFTPTIGFQGVSATAAVLAANTELWPLTATGNTLVSGQFYASLTGLSGLNTGTTDLSSSNYYVIGQPTLVDLNKDEYNAINEGQITWNKSGNGGADAGFTGGSTDLAKAGIVILNKSSVTTNEGFEGYYVGISDNSHSNPATPFDAVKHVYTTTSADDKQPADFTTIPNSRLEFTLSAAATQDIDSTSRSLEDLSSFELGPEFIDSINLGIFKVRNTPFNKSSVELTTFLAEKHTGSLNSARKIQNQNGGSKLPFFIGSVEDNSANIKILVNEHISVSNTDTEWTAAGGAPKKFVRTIHDNNTNAGILKALRTDMTATGQTTAHKNYTGTQGLFPLGNYGTSLNTTSKNIGQVGTKLDRIFNIASNIDLFTIDVTVEAGLGTIHAFGKDSNYDDTSFVNIGDSTNSTGFYTTDATMKDPTGVFAGYRDDYRTIFNAFETFARQTRKDHIFIADALRPLVVQGANQKVLDDKAKTFSQHVYWPLRHQFGTANSNYAATYGNWAKVNDGASGKQVWIPFSGVVAKIYANNDANFAPWFAPAGFNRGIVSGVNDIAISPTQRQRDQLYRIAINPVTQFPAEGIVVFGQKTLQRKPTAFDRVNVRRLFLDLEKRTRQTLKFFVFEPNTFLTRNKVVNTLTPIFENCKQTEGVYDYLIVCDDRNNPASVIDQNELRVDIYLKPVRAAEFILVNFYAVNTDVNFEEIVGQ